MVGWSLNELAAHVDIYRRRADDQSINWSLRGGSLRTLIAYALGRAALFQLFDRWLGRAGYPYVKRNRAASHCRNSDSTVQFQPDDSQRRRCAA